MTGPKYLKRNCNISHFCQHTIWFPSVVSLLPCDTFVDNIIFLTSGEEATNFQAAHEDNEEQMPAQTTQQKTSDHSKYYNQAILLLLCTLCDMLKINTAQ